tara:strand:+ start:4070 stop:4645 length:576 start_codon:yes stop_codon:yes gene_type:complete
MGENRSEGRKKKQREMAQNKPLMVQPQDLEIEMELQKRDQMIKNRYEKDIKSMREMHQREMQNALNGAAKYEPKKMGFFARLKARIRGDESIYIVYNHNQAVYCHKKDCPTRRSGVDYGLEAVTRDIETAFDAIEEYFTKYGEYPWCHAKLLKVKIDGRTRHGVQVGDLTWKHGEWDTMMRSVSENMMRSK